MQQKRRLTRWENPKGRPTRRRVREFPDRIEGDVSAGNEESYLQLCWVYGVLGMALTSWVENEGLMRDGKPK